MDKHRRQARDERADEFWRNTMQRWQQIQRPEVLVAATRAKASEYETISQKATQTQRYT